MKDAVEILKGKKFIRKEIEKQLGSEICLEVWLLAQEKLEAMLEKYKGLSEGVQMHTHGFIFPAAAIYLSLKEKAPVQAFEIMQYTMKEKSTKAGRQIARMTHIPGFKKFFLGMWDSMSHKMFGESAGFKNVFYPAEKGCFRMDITQCPYHTYLTEAGCPELNILFCENDVYSYGNLPGLKFTRIKTIGAGGDCCDFKMELVKQFYTMFQLYFEKTYIIVVPTFKETLVHRHNMLHPAQTGVYQEGISCIKEDDVNLWFYTKNGVTIAIDAGHLVFKGIEEEFKKIGIDPLTIKTLLLTHSDVDHVGGVDRTNKKYLYPNAQVYIGKAEENYFDGHVCRMIKLGIPLMNPARLRDGYKTVKDGDIFYLDDIKVEVFEVMGHTVGHVCYIIDDKILFSGDCLAVNENGGYSLFEFFTQNPALNKKSLIRLRDRITGSGVKIVCTGHSGIRTDMSKLFAHIDESAVSKPGKPFDPTAPKSIRFQKQPNVDQWNKKTYTLLVQANLQN